MNLDLLEKALKKKIGSLYLSKHPSPGVVNDVPNFEEDMLRLRKFQRRVGRHAVFMKARAKDIETRERVITELKAANTAILAGHRILAIDTERWADVTQEIGLTIYEGGQMTSHNLRVMGDGVPPRGDYYHYGESESLTWPETVERVKREAATAKFYVGHSLIGDFESMKDQGLILPKVPFLDTFWLSHIVEGKEGVSLSALAGHFEIETPRPHCGGNDARYNMEVLLALIEAYA